ncbi:UbiA prenyltransferase family protein [Pontibacter beigongshangensis]|uniref:hypothetical protein n=1 Tax=Pontibacter beigongshangensis TaxID=2574733 RepID=UPI00164EDF88|nr:hypothetical protein [Pontibacter beigongshangensis]
MNKDESISFRNSNRLSEGGLFAVPVQTLYLLLNSSLFISCCAFFLTVETFLLAGLAVSLPLATFVFLATLFTYNLSSVQSVLRRSRKYRQTVPLSWVQRYRSELALTGIASLAGAVLIYWNYGLQINLWFILHLALISIGYTVPIIYKSKKVRPLRSVPLLKVFLIAYVWAAVTVYFPIMHAGAVVWEQEVLLLFLRRFMFILALALLFDIRDYLYDQKTRTLTVPGFIGVRNTKLLSLGLLLLNGVVGAVMENAPLEVALLAAAALAALVVLYSSEHKPRVYYALLADGAMLLHAGLVYLATLYA